MNDPLRDDVKAMKHEVGVAIAQWERQALDILQPPLSTVLLKVVDEWNRRNAPAPDASRVEAVARYLAERDDVDYDLAIQVAAGKKYLKEAACICALFEKGERYE